MLSDKLAEKAKSSSGTLFNIQRFSIQDGPGIRTLIFLKGCPLRCLWCCNPESQSAKLDLIYKKDKCLSCYRCIDVCPDDAISKGLQGKIVIDRDLCTHCGECAKECYVGALEMVGEKKTVDEVMNEIMKDITMFRNSGGGVTLSGGEVTTQPDFAAAILKECKLIGIHTAIETCGFTVWGAFEMILPYTDLFLFDLKQMNADKHKELTGQSNEVIIENFKRIKQAGKQIIARIPLIPGLNTSSSNIEELGVFLQENKIDDVHLLPYHQLGVNKYTNLDREYKLNSVSTNLDEDLDKISDLLGSFGLNITLYKH
jgi:pyruvate formate lyase activating enzyme